MIESTQCSFPTNASQYTRLYVAGLSIKLRERIIANPKFLVLKSRAHDLPTSFVISHFAVLVAPRTSKALYAVVVKPLKEEKITQKNKKGVAPPACAQYPCSNSMVLKRRSMARIGRLCYSYLRCIQPSSPVRLLRKLLSAEGNRKVNNVREIVIYSVSPPQPIEKAKIRNPAQRESGKQKSPWEPRSPILSMDYPVTPARRASCFQLLASTASNLLARTHYRDTEFQLKSVRLLSSLITG